MMYKLQIFCHDDSKIINRIIDAASKAGAGVMGNYTHCATVFKGEGRWLSMPGSHPNIGKPGTLSKEQEVKIEMHCPKDKAKAVLAAIKRVHPYEEPAIELIRMEEI